MKMFVFFISLLALGTVFYSSSTRAQPDCNMSTEKRLKYLHYNHGVDLGVDKPLPGCPGWDDIDPGFANLEIAGTKFRIPRDYIAFFPEEADGPSGRVVIRVGPRSFNDLWHTLIDEGTTDIFLFKDLKRQSCGRSRCYSSEHVEFLALVRGVRLKSVLDDPDRSYALAQNFLENAKPGSGKFLGFSVAENADLSVAFRKEKGNIFEWFICSREKARCRSKTKITSKIYMRLSREFIGLNDLKAFKTRVENTLLPRFTVAQE